MPKPQREMELLQEICETVLKTGRLPSRDILESYPIFQKRFEKAVETVERRSVSKYTFFPSGRVVWTVKGKSGEYQVIPETNFCSCDDFYFRVMGYKRQVCYHMMAQKVANSLKMFNQYELRDHEYDHITEKWRVKEPQKTVE